MTSRSPSLSELLLVIERMRTRSGAKPAVPMTEHPKRMRTSSGAEPAVPRPAGAAMVVPVKQEVGQVAAGAAVAQTSQAARTIADNVMLAKEWLRCTACSGLLRPPIYKCNANGHKVCGACREGDNDDDGRCRACNGASSSRGFARCEDLDDLMGALVSPCPHTAYGCRRQVAYRLVDEHMRECPHAPCTCSEASCGGFLGSPRMLHDHLTLPPHSWPSSRIQYGKVLVLQNLAVVERRRLIVAEDGPVLVLAVAELAGMTTVTLTCLRASVAGGPQFRALLWAHAPADPETGVEGCRTAEDLVAIRASPGEDAGDEGVLLPLPRRFLRGAGASSHIILYIRIDKLKNLNRAAAGTPSPSAGSS